MLATALWDNSALQKLELGDNGIGDQGAGAFPQGWPLPVATHRWPQPLASPAAAAAGPFFAGAWPTFLPGVDPPSAHPCFARTEDLLEAASRNSTLLELGLQGNIFDLSNLEDAVLGVRSSLVLGL